MAEISADGGVHYVTASERTLLEELWIDRRVLYAADVLKARNYQPTGGDTYSISMYFKAYDERLYGMGQYPNGYLNLKGCVLELSHKNTQISILFLVSTRGMGLFGIILLLVE